MKNTTKTITRWMAFILLFGLLRIILTVLSFFDIIIDWFKHSDVAAWKYRIQAFGAIAFIFIFAAFAISLGIQASHVSDSTTVVVIRIIAFIVFIIGFFLGVLSFPKKNSGDLYYKPYR